jgi:hypothetical protein
VISPTLISPERYEWLHVVHSRRAHPEAFLHNLLKLLARYHPRAESLNPQGHQLKLANHYTIPTPIRQALEQIFLVTTELFGSPLNCSMTGGIIYYSAFPEDITFGAILNSFRCRWTGSCLTYPEYEQEDMLKAVLHALASPEDTETTLLVVLVLPVWDDSPWTSSAAKGHNNMSTLIHIPAGHMRFVPAHMQSVGANFDLSPARWPVEVVLIANEKGREAFADHNRIQMILALAILATCRLTPKTTIIFPPQPSEMARYISRRTPQPLRPIPACPATPAPGSPLGIAAPPRGHTSAPITRV